MLVRWGGLVIFGGLLGVFAKVMVEPGTALRLRLGTYLRNSRLGCESF